MRALLRHPACPHMSPVQHRGSAPHHRPPHAAAARMQQPHRHWRGLRAVPDEGNAAEPTAAASEGQPSTSGAQEEANPPKAPSVSNLAASLGSQKAFVSEDEWRVMDKKVNKYPSQRTFTAIGTGGDDFKGKMLKAVEAVVGTVHVECVSERPSSGGKYVSVRIGPVWVESADQVVQVFSKMREDQRLKWYM